MEIPDWIQLGICIAAVVGIFMTWYSVRSQNKQSLFEIRSKNYTTLSRLMERYSNFADLLAVSMKTDESYKNTIRGNSRELLLRAIGFELNRNNDSVWGHDANERLLRITQILIGKIENTITELSLLYNEELVEDPITFLENYRKLIMNLFDYELNVANLGRRKEATINLLGNYASFHNSEKGLKESYKKIVANETLTKMKRVTKI